MRNHLRYPVYLIIFLGVGPLKPLRKGRMLTRAAPMESLQSVNRHSSYDALWFFQCLVVKEDLSILVVGGGDSGVNECILQRPKYKKVHQEICQRMTVTRDH